MRYRLFGEKADYYDWHTPPHHYQHDHSFVLSRLRAAKGPVLDVGCGTGVFLEKALAAGFDVHGRDASTDMIALAGQRVDPARLVVERMQDMADERRFSGIVSLSWSFNYVRSLREAADVLARFFTAMKPKGVLILQIAHAPNATGALNEDREPGPTGSAEDIVFLYRFRKARNRGELKAQYVFGCKSTGELLFEEHHLRAANAHIVANLARKSGFVNVALLDSWRGEPLDRSLNVFLLAQRP